MHNSLKSKKKKILFLITKSNWGGAQHYVYDLAVHASQSHDVVVGFGPPQNTHTYTSTLKSALEKHTIRTITLPLFARDINLIQELQGLFVLLRLFLHEHPDIVHLNSSKITGLGAVAGRLYNLLPTTKHNVKTVVTIHGWPFNESRHYFKQSLMWLFSWFTAIFAHHVILVSHYDRNKARHMPFVSHKMSVIHNGIDAVSCIEKSRARTALLEHLTQQQQEHVQQIRTPQTLWIGMIGELHFNKGYGYALQAFAEFVQTHPNSFLCIIGAGEEQTRIEQLVALHNLENRVLLVGHISSAASYLHAFDIFLMSSTKEGFPYVLLEAGYAGVPTIATSVGGIPEIIDDMKNGILIRPQNTTEITAALRVLADMPHKRKEFGTALCEKTERLFTKETMIQATARVYEMV